MPTISPFGLDGNHDGVDCYTLWKLLDITYNTNTKILSPFDIKGRGQTNILSFFDIHYVVNAPPKYKQSL